MPTIGRDRWRVLSPYLDTALDMPTADRITWLGAVRARDAALAADLTALLREHDALHESKFLERAVLEDLSERPSPAGQVIGAYRLLSQIGHGGTGSVWLAERCDGRFEGRVAVKLLNLSLVGLAGEERFRREGTILARLRHPRIAHLVDAGVSSTGQPYLVLEHVDGQTIDAYCNERALGIEARVRLFLDVLDAVAHAHANLTVHRDIKPPNVLVSRDGQVKLLDFGIAKLLEQGGGGDGSTPAGTLTRDLALALTPEYAAPEQLAGGSITTATDVYALGVLLYVLLTGRHPAGRAVESTATLVRAIVDLDPPHVSDAVVSDDAVDEEQVRHATRCGTTPARLRRLLRGDLDTIVAKALKKNAAERYPSVTALADDLRRHLRHQPIGARPDTLRYRAGRFLRRHVAGAVAFLGVVLLTATLVTIHTLRLSAERDRARRETAKAVKVSELLTGLLTRADPYAGRDVTTGEPTVRALLDAGASKVERDLAGEPELQANMLMMFGRTYRRLGVYDKAQHVLEQALASGHTAFGAEHAVIAQTLDSLGALLAEKGEYREAQRTLEEALAMRRKVLGREHPDVAVTLAELGRVYQDQGLNARAEPLHREALAIRRKALGDVHSETAVSFSDLGSVLRLNGDLDGAEVLLRRSYEINRKLRGDDHPNTATNLHDLALITATRGDRAAAEPMFRAAYAVQRKTLGGAHPVVATTLNSLARLLRDEGRYDEASARLQEALDIARAAFGGNHQLIAIYSINLAVVQLLRHEPAAAEALLRDAVTIRSRAPQLVPARRRTVREDDWSVPATERLLGQTLLALGRSGVPQPMLTAARSQNGPPVF